MAGRYGLNLRPLYDPNELTGGEQLQRGIGAAIAEKENEVAADNQRRAQGQVLTGQTSVMDRVRGAGRRVAGIGSAIRGALGDEPDIPGQPDEPEVPPSPAAVNAGIARGVPGVQGMQGNVPQSPNIAAPELTPNYAPPPMTPAQHGLAGARPAGAPGVAGIASAIQPYEEHDTHGNTWSVDPLHAARVKQAGDDLGNADKIQSLIDAGMPAAEARARVENNVVRYDSEFGQQFRPTSNSGLTFAQRKQLQDDAIAGRARLAALARSGRQNTEEYRQESLKLRARELDLREHGQEQVAEGRYANTEAGAARLDYGRGKEPDPIAASMETPEAKAARMKANRSGDAHAKNVSAVQERRRNALVKDPATLLAERKRLIASGMTKEAATADMQRRGFNVQ